MGALFGEHFDFRSLVAFAPEELSNAIEDRLFLLFVLHGGGTSTIQHHCAGSRGIFLGNAAFYLSYISYGTEAYILPALAMIATVVVAAQAAPADQIFADWDAGNPGCDVGVWTDDCWGNEPMPNNGNMGFTYVAGISDGNATVTMNLNITLDGLIIFGDPQVNVMNIPNGLDLTIVGFVGDSTGFITIDDRLFMQSRGSATNIFVSGGGTTLTIDGTGELLLFNNVQNRIRGIVGNETISFGPCRQS